jgi:hypothetical protein
MFETGLKRGSSTAGRKWTLRRLLLCDTTIQSYRRDSIRLEQADVHFFGPASQLPPVEVDPVLVELLFGPDPEHASLNAAIPAGIHERSAFSRVLASDEAFTGVVAHIALDGGSARAKKLFDSLLDESDFGCHVAEDEFILICPNLEGDQARHRLESISERLWRFQLGFAEDSTILFSWGGVEARNERLLDAATRATEKMLQTKYRRRTVSIDSMAQKRAV